MKKLTLLLLFISTLYFSQNQRFIYEYRFTIDSTKVDTLNSELMYLDVTKEGSKFYSRAKLVADSILRVQVEALKNNGSRHINMKGVNRGKIDWSVEKTYPEIRTKLIDRIGMDTYEVFEDRNLDWKILPDKEKIEKFETQKATLNFAGRNWTAWFAPDIPIHDGPYKFHGLPGLIVKMEDESKTHLFDLKGVETLEENEESVSSNGFGYRQKIAVDNTKYKKAFLAHRKDPNKGIRQMMGSVSGTATFKMTDQNGKELDMKDMMKKSEERQKARNARENNFLEKDILD